MKDKIKNWQVALYELDTVITGPKLRKFAKFAPYFVLQKLSLWLRIDLLVHRRLFFGKDMAIRLPGAGDIFLYGCKSHDSEIRLCRYLMEHIQPGALVLDIGAHFGYFSMLLSELVGKSGKVLSFEPSENAFHLLTKNTKAYPQTEIFHKVVSAHHGHILFREFESRFAEYNTAEIQTNTTFPYKEIQLETITIDDITKNQIKKVGFVKIDVEGHELEVLLGMEHTIKTQLPVLSLEYVPDHKDKIKTADQWLQKFGYQAHLIRPDGSLQKTDIDVIRSDSENVIYQVTSATI